LEIKAMSVSVSSEKPEFKELLLQLQAAIAKENTELSIQSIENPEKGVIAIFVNALTDEKWIIRRLKPLLHKRSPPSRTKR
jgi:hypothetical protein